MGIPGNSTCIVAYIDFGKSVFKRFANCFWKSFASQLSDSLTIQEKDKKKTDTCVKNGGLRF